jgi:hypothetical protein
MAGACETPIRRPPSRGFPASASRRLDRPCLRVPVLNVWYSFASYTGRRHSPAIPAAGCDSLLVAAGAGTSGRRALRHGTLLAGPACPVRSPRGRMPRRPTAGAGDHLPRPPGYGLQGAASTASAVPHKPCTDVCSGGLVNFRYCGAMSVCSAASRGRSSDIGWPSSIPSM